jgi:hypothetical protein
MKRVVLAAGALLALVYNQAAAATAFNGAPIDPANLIADDLEAEALASYARNAAARPFRGQTIVVVDYRKPSSTKRLFLLNLATGAVEPHYVAHGRGSDPEHTTVAMRFGDVTSSGMSSLGAYRGLERYQSPAHGPALRLAGLDRSNRSAYERLIVVHTAPYFDPANGKYGRSLGCFVVTTEDRARIYDIIADGGFLYAGPSCLGAGATACRKPDTSLMAEAAPAAPVAVAAATPAPPPAPAPKPAPVQPPPVVLAAAAPRATLPKPAVMRAAPPPVVLADAVPTPSSKPRLDVPVLVAFAAPVPTPKPVLAAPAIDTPEQIAAALEVLGRAPAPSPLAAVAVALDVPEPLAKPALLAEAGEPGEEVPVPLLKPALDTQEPAPLLAASDIVTGQGDLAAADGAIPLPQSKPELAGVLAADLAPVVPTAAPGEVPIPAPKPGGLRRMADAGPMP